LKNALFTISLTFTSIIAFGQQLPGMAVDSIYSKVKNPNSAFFYDTLFARYSRGDRGLSDRDFHYLYYGFIFHDGYDPEGERTVEKAFFTQIDQREYDRAYQTGIELLQQDPFHPEYLFAMQITVPEEKRSIWKWRYEQVVKTIYNLNAGNTPENAMIITDSRHAPAMAQALGLRITNMSVDESILAVDVVQPNEHNIATVYFNVILPQSFLEYFKELNDMQD
jgi:hypothetical protein